MKKNAKVLIAAIIVVIVCILVFLFRAPILSFIAPTSEPMSSTKSQEIVAAQHGQKVDAPIIWPEDFTAPVCPVESGPSGEFPLEWLAFFNNNSNFLEKSKELKIPAEFWFGDREVPPAYLFNGVLTLTSKENEKEGSLITSAYNYDVRTGEKLILRDVFADNVDVELELNRQISLYLLGQEGIRADKFKGVSMETEFCILPMDKYSSDGGMTYNSDFALTLFFDEKTPLLEGQTLIFKLDSFGNDGDVIAWFNRFPPLTANDEIASVPGAQVDSFVGTMIDDYSPNQIVNRWIIKYENPLKH